MIYKEQNGQSSYDGNWRDDKRDGRGEMKWANGAHYNGDWKGDVKHGSGVYTWPN